ncbi:MAG: cupin domain-containing protein [Lutimonas sp.]|jgi:mannose-6-phosphate isomerase-like protein (cupin superfamily)|uniref:cupin domain-containing protein n=1 Tax=Robiginitalea sp. TaxID=1902411 RepID=UPI003C7796BF
MKTTFISLKSKKQSLIFHLVFTLLLMGFSLDATAQEDSVKSILERFATDYKKDPMFTSDHSFGLEVDKEMWHIEAIAATEKSSAVINIAKGSPAKPTFYYKTNSRTLRQLDKGELNALTAGVKAFSTDFAPFDLEVMEGFQPDEKFVGDVLGFTFHFWTKGMPEIVPFGQHYTRGTHGAQAAIFYYDTGLRTGYGYLHPGQHANEHPQSKTNPFSSMIILIKGKVKARLNDIDYEIEAGNAFFIPPGMTHEVLNPYDEPAEFILLMFGEGA